MRIHAFLLGLALSTGARAGSFTWKMPDVITAVQVPGVSEAGGIPVKFDAWLCRGTVEDLAVYFQGEFLKAGLYVPPREDQLNLGTHLFQLTALDPDKQVSYTVILQPYDKNSTTVITSQAYLADVAQQRGPTFAPTFPSASSVVQTNVEGMRTLTYEVAASPEDVSSFYREVLGKERYAEVEPGVFRRSTDEITIRAEKRQEKLQVLVMQKTGALWSEPEKASTR